MGTWEWTILDFIQQHIKNDVLDASYADHYFSWRCWNYMDTD